MRLHEWVEHYARTHLGLAASSATQLRVAVRRLGVWAGRSIDTTELSAELVVDWLAWQLRQGWAPATVRSKRLAILTLWRAAHKAGLAPSVGEVPPPRVPRRLPEAWTVEEIGRILGACRRQRGMVGPCQAARWWPALVLVCYDTGERVGALRAISIDDFSAERACVVVRAEHQKLRRDRVLPLSQQTVDSLVRLHSYGCGCHCSVLFPWPFSRDRLWRWFRRIVESAGLRTPKQRMGLFHRLRRTSGSLVEAAGGDGSRHLGNSRAVFERHYLDPRIGGQGQLGYLPRPPVSV